MNPSESEQIRARQRSRNLVVGLILGGLVILFYAISIVKIAVPPPKDAAQQAASQQAASQQSGQQAGQE
jgi:hypothetical protein